MVANAIATSALVLRHKIRLKTSSPYIAIFHKFNYNPSSISDTETAIEVFPAGSLPGLAPYGDIIETTFIKGNMGGLVVIKLKAGELPIHIKNGGVMKIAVSGKGGVGKTTIAGTLARLLAQNRQRVLALDSDSNPNLAHSLGIPRGQIAQLPAVPMGLTEWREDTNGKAYVHLRQPVSQLIADYSIPAPDGVQLILTGEVEKASAGCRCEAHAVARGITGHLVSEADVAVLDMEAGLEHLGRGTTEHVDILLIVTESYFRALEAATRIRDLAVQLELPHILTIANRVRTPQDEVAVRQYCQNHRLELVAAIPYDNAVVTAELQGQAVVDYAPGCPAVQAVSQLVNVLRARLG